MKAIMATITGFLAIFTTVYPTTFIGVTVVCAFWTLDFIINPSSFK